MKEWCSLSTGYKASLLIANINVDAKEMKR